MARIDNPFELVEVQLMCERCGASYHGERPAFWVAKEEPGHVWLGYCATCEALRAKEQEAFRQRTALRYGKTATVEEEPDLKQPKEEGDDTNVIPITLPPPEEPERDRYGE